MIHIIDDPSSYIIVIFHKIPSNPKKPPFFIPSGMMKVSWDDEIPNICKNKTCSKPPTSHSYPQPLGFQLRSVPSSPPEATNCCGSGARARTGPPCAGTRCFKGTCRRYLAPGGWVGESSVYIDVLYIYIYMYKYIYICIYIYIYIHR